ncbi:MAG: replication factor C small subunit [Candidatus Micrarchaeota archaeon]|nr:replication factor C small subunit [Candidatus Micrarchaeota archaeon]
MSEDPKTGGKKPDSDFEPWVEKYRPRKLGAVVGHKAITDRLKAYAESRNMPHLLFSGRAGIGKTACALALANELYGDAMEQCFQETNASDERGIEVVRGKIKDFARTMPFSSVPFKIIFLDEADALTPDAQQALRRTMEKFSKACRFILSANYSSRIIEPVQSRCAVFRFSPLSDEDIEKIIDHVAKSEGLKLDEAARKAVVYVSGGDGRKAINCLQGASAAGERVTDEQVFSVASRARPEEVGKLVRLALEGKFSEARRMLDEVMIRYGLSGEDVISQVYREIVALDIPDAEKVVLVDRVGEYDFRMTEGANERIQLEALLAQIMLAGKGRS